MRGDAENPHHDCVSIESMSDEDKIQSMRDCGMEIDDTVPCLSCGQEPEWRECATCGTQAWVVDCGHKAQPRPIAADDQDPLHNHICDACYEARAERSKAASTLGRKGGLVKNEARAAASRANGAKGGRPRANISLKMAQRIPISDELAKALRAQVVGGDSRSRGRCLELLRNEARRVMSGGAPLHPGRPILGGKTVAEALGNCGLSWERKA